MTKRTLAALALLVLGLAAAGSALAQPENLSRRCAGYPEGACAVLTDADKDGDYADDFSRLYYRLLYPNAGKRSTKTAQAVTCDGQRVCALTTPTRSVFAGTFTATDGTLTVTDDGEGNIVGDVKAPTEVEGFDTECSAQVCLGGDSAVALSPTPIVPGSLTFSVSHSGGTWTCVIDASGLRESGDCTTAAVNYQTGVYTVLWPGTPTGNTTADFIAGATNTIDYDTGEAQWQFDDTPSTVTASYEYQADPRTPYKRVRIEPPPGVLELGWKAPFTACWNEWLTTPTGYETPPCDLAADRFDDEGAFATEVVLGEAWNGVELACDFEPGALGLPAGNVACFRVGNAETTGLASAQDGYRPRFAMEGRPTIKVVRTPASGTHKLSAFWRDGGEGTYRWMVDFPASGLDGTGRGAPALLVGPRATSDIDVPTSEASRNRINVLVDGRQERSVVSGTNTYVLVGPLVSTADQALGIPGGDDLCHYAGTDYDCEGLSIANLAGSVRITEFRDLVIRDSRLVGSDGGIGPCVELLDPATIPGASRRSRWMGSVNIAESTTCRASASAGGFVRIRLDGALWDCCGGTGATPLVLDGVVRVAGTFNATAAGARAIGVDNEHVTIPPPGFTGTGRGVHVVDAGVVLAYGSVGNGGLYATGGPGVTTSAYQGKIASNRSQRVELFALDASPITPPQCLRGRPADGAFANCASASSGWVAPRKGFVGEAAIRLTSSVSANTKACTARWYRNGALMDTVGPGKSAQGVDYRIGSSALDQVGEEVRHFVNDEVNAGDLIELRLEAPLSQFCGAGAGCVCDDPPAFSAWFDFLEIAP